jgi:hypothetical protein
MPTIEELKTTLKQLTPNVTISFSVWNIDPNRPGNAATLLKKKITLVRDLIKPIIDANPSAGNKSITEVAVQ